MSVRAGIDDGRVGRPATLEHATVNVAPFAPIASSPIPSGLRRTATSRPGPFRRTGSSRSPSISTTGSVGSENGGAGVASSFHAAYGASAASIARYWAHTCAASESVPGGSCASITSPVTASTSYERIPVAVPAATTASSSHAPDETRKPLSTFCGTYGSIWPPAYILT